MSDRLLTELELTQTSLPQTLVDEAGYAHLAIVAEALPTELTTFWGLECRMGEPAAVADILCEIKNGSRGQALLAGTVPSPIDFLCNSWSAWQNLRNLSQLWADPAHPFHTNIHNIWLEFDTASACSHKHIEQIIGDPCIFFGPKSTSDHQFSQIIVDALIALRRFDLSQKNYQRFIHFIPDGAHLFQVGLMAARPEPGLRVCINEMTAEEICRLLPLLHWSGNLDAMLNLLKTLASLARHIAIGLNITEHGIGEKIGIECYMDWSKDTAEQWIPLLDFIENLGLCIPQKRQGFLAFPGISETPLSQRLRPDGMLSLNLFRKIHHLKLAVVNDQPIEAKAYLACIRPSVAFGSSMKVSQGLKLPTHNAWSVE